MLSDDACYRAVQGKDARFDGVFYSGVTSTGIYCRPSCPAITPKRSNLRFYPSAAAAQEAGFRACKRCRPDAAPGSPEWNLRRDLVGRAMRLIADGAVDRDGVAGLASALNYSERQLNRQLVAGLGAGPLALARAQRARTARILLETSGIPISEVAFAAGFSSIRQFNDTIQQVFALTPSELRTRASRRSSAARKDSDQHSIALRLPYRRPIALRTLLDFFGHRAVTGIEEYIDGSYRRSLVLPHGKGVVEVRESSGDNSFVECRFWLDDLQDLTAAVQRTRRMFDLDADPVVIDEQLGSDPLLAPLIAARPGLRVPGSVDANETAVRIVIGQQVSTAGARTIAGRLVSIYGQELKHPVGAITHTFPLPEVLAEVDPGHLPMPTSRKRALHLLAAALADNSLELGPGSDWDDAAARLLALPGVGPWTVAAIRMRGLGDPDVFLATDLGVRKAMTALAGLTDEKSLKSYAQAWQPWRSYTTHHLWASLDSDSVTQSHSPQATSA